MDNLFKHGFVLSVALLLMLSLLFALLVSRIQVLTFPHYKQNYYDALYRERFLIKQTDYYEIPKPGKYDDKNDVAEERILYFSIGRAGVLLVLLIWWVV
jgi:hypothetical protein